MSAAAANSIAATLTQETTANARPTRKSIWPLPGRPQHEILRKLAGNVGKSAASMRLLLDKVNKVCDSSLGHRAYPKTAPSPVRMHKSGEAADRRYQRRGHSVVRAPCVT